MSRSFILQFIRSLPFVRWEREAPAHIAFHDLLCQRSAQTNRWELFADQPRQTWGSPGPFFNKTHACRTATVLCFSHHQMGTFADANERTVRVCLAHSAPAICISPSLSSPLKLQGHFTRLLLQGRHLGHCDANSLKCDVWGLFFKVRIGLWDRLFDGVQVPFLLSQKDLQSRVVLLGPRRQI